MRYTYLTGCCANGAQRDAGRLFHAVPGNSAFGKALCGATPGRRSSGWSESEGKAPTCDRCRSSLEWAPMCVLADAKETA